MTLVEKARRKEKEFNKRRREILVEAENLFAVKGFHATTMADIAQAAGFAIGTLYQFFSGKESLYASMVIEKLQRMYRRIRAAVKSRENTLERVEALVKSYLLFAQNNAGFCTFFVRSDGAALPDMSSDLQEQMIAAYLEQIHFIEGIISKGIEEGIFQPAKARDYAFALSGIIRGIIFDWLVGKQQGSLTGKTGLVTDIFLKGILQKGY